MDYKLRQQKLTARFPAHKVDALLVTALPNVRYLCGFTGSAGVLAVVPGGRSPKLAFFTDGRYTEQAQAEVEGARVVIAKGPSTAAALDWLAKQGARRIGIESEHVTVAQQAAMSKHVAKGAKLVPVAGAVEALRMIKERTEIEQIRMAVLLGSELFPKAVSFLQKASSEMEVAARMEFEAKRLGAEAMSFETIVASGPRSALPHGRASAAAVARSGFVVLDFGVILGGYCSDMTRTVHMGRANGTRRRMYEAVLEAQLAAIGAVRPGATCGEVDAAARRVLQRAGLGKFFAHSTGHGVGLEIHEPPRVGSKQAQRLEPGMVITIEPGVYVAGDGGVRIEDMVVVTDTGCEVLTPTPKELITVS